MICGNHSHCCIWHSLLPPTAFKHCCARSGCRLFIYSPLGQQSLTCFCLWVSHRASRCTPLCISAGSLFRCTVGPGSGENGALSSVEKYSKHRLQICTPTALQSILLLFQILAQAWNHLLSPVYLWLVRTVLVFFPLEKWGSAGKEDPAWINSRCTWCFIVGNR